MFNKDQDTLEIHDKESESPLRKRVRVYQRSVHTSHESTSDPLLEGNVSLGNVRDFDIKTREERRVMRQDV